MPPADHDQDDEYGPVQQVTLTLDRFDYETIQTELASRRAIAEASGFDVTPYGESCELGAVLAECIRSLDEYRALHDPKHPKLPAGDSFPRLA